MKIDKSVAGYHMLVILSEVDGYFDTAEKKIIAQYIKDNTPKHRKLKKRPSLQRWPFG